MDGVSVQAPAIIVSGAGRGLSRTDVLEICRRGGLGTVNDFGSSISGKGAPNTAVDSAVTGICLQGRKAAANYDHVLRSEEHTSELQSLMRISYAVFCLKKKKNHKTPP